MLSCIIAIHCHKILIFDPTTCVGVFLYSTVYVIERIVECSPIHYPAYAICSKGKANHQLVVIVIMRSTRVCFKIKSSVVFHTQTHTVV